MQKMKTMLLVFSLSLAAGSRLSAINLATLQEVNLVGEACEEFGRVLSKVGLFTAIGYIFCPDAVDKKFWFDPLGGKDPKAFIRTISITGACFWLGGKFLKFATPQGSL